MGEMRSAILTEAEHDAAMSALERDGGADAWTPLVDHDNALRAECDVLRTALQTYGEHRRGCQKWSLTEAGTLYLSDAPECTCGLAAALAAPVAPTPEPE